MQKLPGQIGCVRRCRGCRQRPRLCAKKGGMSEEKEKIKVYTQQPKAGMEKAKVQKK